MGNHTIQMKRDFIMLDKSYDTRIIFLSAESIGRKVGSDFAWSKKH